VERLGTDRADEFPVVFGAIKLAGPGIGVVFVFHLTIPFWV
jgi:hypothetical protein